MINIKNIKVSFTLLSKGMGITCITMLNALFPLNTFAQEVSCINFWTNPTPIPLDDYLAKIPIVADFTLFSFGSLMAGWE